MTKNVKKALSVFLSLLMVLSVVPLGSVMAQAATAVCNIDYLQLRWLTNESVYLDASGKSRPNASVSGSTLSWNATGDYPGANFDGTGNSRIWNNFTINNLLSDGICSGIESSSQIGTTVAFMARTNTPDAATPFFCLFNSSYSSNGKKTLFSLAPNGGIVYVNSSGSGYYPATDAKANDTNWHTYVVKFFYSKYCEVWVDGVLKYREQSAYYDNHTFDVPNSIKVGANREDNSFFNGSIRDFRIYNKDLPAADVHQNLLTIAEESKVKEDTLTNKGLTLSGHGVVISGSESRWSNGQMNIVNDQQANNTDAGLLAFDISGLAGYKVTEAKFTGKVDSWSGDTETLGIQYYWSTDSGACSGYVASSGKETQGVGTAVGSGTTGRDALLTKLGTNSGNLVGTINKSSTNVTSFPFASNSSFVGAINAAIEAGASKLYVVIVQEKAGGAGNTSGWSDTKVTPGNHSLEVSAVLKSSIKRARDEITDSIRPDASLVAAAPYKASATAAADGSYSGTGLVSGDKMSNVLWSYGVGPNSGFSSTADKDYFSAGIQYGNVTLLYDGENQMAFPVTYFITRTKPFMGSTYPQRPLSTCPTGSMLSLKKIWHGYSEAPGYQTSTEYGVNYIDAYTASNPGWHTIRDGNVTDYYSNTLYVQNINSSLFTNNLYTLNSGWNIYVQDNNGSKTYYRELSCNNDSQRIRIIDYSKVYSAIKTAKTIYNTVRDNEMAYCPTDLYNFYQAFSKIISVNPNSYFTTDSTSGNNYQACADAICALEAYIPAATTMPTASDWSYTYNGGTTYKHTGTCSICSETYTTDCTYVIKSSVPSTCSQKGTATYECTDCKSTKTTELSLNDHSLVKKNAVAPDCTTDGTIEHYRCSVCQKYFLDEQGKNEVIAADIVDPARHTLVQYAEKKVTCTEDGWNAYYACSKCDYSEKEIITATGHKNWSEWNITKEPTCSEKGWHEHACGVCGAVEGEEIDFAPHTEIIDDGKEATCTESGLTAGAHCLDCGAVTLAQEIIPAKGHQHIVLVPAKDVKCEENGNIAYYVCNDCDSMFSDAQGTTNIGPDDVIIIAEGHKALSEKTTETIKAATCTEAGSYYEITKCAVCGEEMERVEKTENALDHNFGVFTYDGATAKTHTRSCQRTGCTAKETVNCSFGAAVHTKNATCLNTGIDTYTCTVCNGQYTETVDQLDHSYNTAIVKNNGDGTHSFMCMNGCGKFGDVYGDKEACAGGTATCVAKAVCSTCNTAYGELAEHVWGEGVVTTPATCVAEGEMTYTCTVDGCGATKTEKIEAAGAHTFTSYASNGDATCKADGTKTATCDFCNATDTVTDVDSHLAVAHTFTVYTSNNDATCKDDGTKTATCDVCENATDTVTDVDSHLAVAHTFTVYTSNNDATCKDDGTKTATCDVCENATDTVTDVDSHLAVAHTFTTYTSNNDATCKDDGTKTATCDVCEAATDTVTDVDSHLAVAHTFTTYTSNNDATCKDDGTKTATCDVCEAATDTVTDVDSHLAVAHTFTTYTSNNDATCKVDGTKTATCDVCENATDTVTDVDSHLAVAHTFTTYTSNNDATCKDDGTKTATCDVCENATDTVTDVDSHLAVAHTFTTYTSNNDATCKDDGTKTATCDVCENATDTVTDVDSHLAVAHTWNNGEITNPVTCLANGEMTYTCTVCNATRTEPIEAKGAHTFTVYTSNNDATCKADGTKTATCDFCNATDTVTDVDSHLAVAHTFTVYTSNNDATCKDDGTKTATCDVCENATDTVTDVDSHLAVAHTFTNYVSDGNVTCVADGTKTAKCDVCGVATKTVDDIDSHLTAAHKFTTFVSDGNATCIADGTSTAVCDVCGVATKTVDDIDSHLTAAHAWNDGEETKPVTCKADGIMTYTCTLCSKTKTEVITATGVHTPGEETKENVVAGTCKTEGSYDKVVKCSVCGETISREKVNTGYGVHNIVERDAVAATCTTDGKTAEKYCSVCGTVTEKGKVIPATGHHVADTVYASGASDDGSYTWKTYKCKDCNYKLVTLSLMVLSETNSPLEGADVQIKDTDGKVVSTGKTDANGKYTVTNLPEGAYTVEVNHAGTNNVGKGTLVISNGSVKGTYTEGGRLWNAAGTGVCKGCACHHDNILSRLQRLFFTLLSVIFRKDIKCCPDMKWYGGLK